MCQVSIDFSAQNWILTIYVIILALYSQEICATTKEIIYCSHFTLGTAEEKKKKKHTSEGKMSSRHISRLCD